MVHEIRDSGGEVVLLDEAAARARVPLLRSGCVALAALDSDAMDIDVNELHQGFLRGCSRSRRKAGDRPLDALGAAAQRQLAHRRAGGTATAPALINAAGAWADEVAGSAVPTRSGCDRCAALHCWSTPPTASTSGNGRPSSMPTSSSISDPKRASCCCRPPMRSPIGPATHNPRNSRSPSAWTGCRPCSTSRCGGSARAGQACGPSAPDRVPVLGYDPVFPAFSGAPDRADTAYRQRRRWRERQRHSRSRRTCQPM